MKSLKTLFIASLVGASFLSPGQLMAQDAADTPPAPAQVNWVTQCTSDVRGGVINCLMEQKIALRDSGQLVVAITIQIQPETRTPSMVIQVPLGVFLPGGVIAQIDDGFSQPYEIKTCDSSGCYVGDPLSEAMITALQGGENFNIKFQNFSQEEIVIPVPLTGFTDSYFKIR